MTALWTLLILLLGAPTVPEVDELEVIAVVDNFYDCFQRDEGVATRHNLAHVDGFDAIRLHAEMGLAYVIRARVGSTWHTILFDFGLSPEAYTNNLGRLGLDIAGAEALVLSHAHEDHYGGVAAVVGRVAKPIVIVGGADAFAPRRFVAGERNWDMGTLSRSALESAGATVRVEAAPVVVAGVGLVSGTIPQATPFERVPPFLKMIDATGQVVQDPMSHELALAFRVRGRGLVVITSCAHAGVINSIRHLQAVSGEPHLHAVIGGMHLTSAPDEVVAPTVDALIAAKPDWVAPAHCTGQKAMLRLQNELAAAYVHPSVGTKLRFGAP